MKTDKAYVLYYNGDNPTFLRKWQSFSSKKKLLECWKTIPKPTRHWCKVYLETATLLELS